MKKIFLILPLLFLAPIALFAQEFVPITPDFPIASGETATFTGLLNTFLTLTIAVAAILAVIQIGIGAFRYMMSESITGKGDGRQTIQDAVVGLLIVLATILILETINPEIIGIDVFRRAEPLSSGPATSPTRSSDSDCLGAFECAGSSSGVPTADELGTFDSAETLQTVVEEDDRQFFSIITKVGSDSESVLAYATTRCVDLSGHPIRETVGGGGYTFTRLTCKK